jgi:hypothetical protein
MNGTTSLAHSKQINNEAHAQRQQIYYKVCTRILIKQIKCQLIYFLTTERFELLFYQNIEHIIQHSLKETNNINSFQLELGMQILVASK